MRVVSDTAGQGRQWKWMGIAVCNVLLAVAPRSFAQDPIRVETNQVLVPVFVDDRTRVDWLSMGSENLNQAVKSGDMRRVAAVVDSAFVRNLAAADFRVFEDGKEQAVRNVSYERSLYWDVQDTRGHHTEYIGLGGGKWSTDEWMPEVYVDVAPAHYLLAYSPPNDNPVGSCHRIKVKVNRPNTLLAFRSEYCNIVHSASDPLKGSKLGALLEKDLLNPPSNGVPIHLSAVAYFTGDDLSSVHISVDWSSKSLKSGASSIGILGFLYRPDGTTEVGFSDLADIEGISGHLSWGIRPGVNDFVPDENRYDRRLSLPRGEYKLKIVVGNGKKSGVAEVPIKIARPSDHGLVISEVSLSKQVSDTSKNSLRMPGDWKSTLPDSYAPLISNETEFMPTSDTKFKSGDSLYFYFEIFVPSCPAKVDLKIELQIRIIDLKSGAVISDPQPVSAAPYMHSGSPMIPIGRGIDISKLPKGNYRLEVQASDSDWGKSAWRTVDFSVE